LGKKKEAKFNTALNKLEKSVKRLEEAEIDLEKFVDIFVEGMENAAFCQEKLNEAQKKVDIVLKELGRAKEELREFDESELLSEE
jgi:exodeoxyribonuclease VII small subunit